MANGDCATPAERLNASQDEAAMVCTCKRRLCRTASGDCATPTDRCNASQDDAEVDKYLQATTALNGKRRFFVAGCML
eukprot:CAMPEP_0203847506 /NCGR_PEP_ID=MMETSP0359-20131031/5053_1 /ASSEMBLY_ACC=CAM_ASM_000338 /TAXON_ID=268821 /ORGANISM="Scrippsiella Hangoei, Strain SHTV-5" /LENGTH=77 /DNA_ID=CAMNT_0050762971 /DNA_START=3 /DNA_END=236 /DNA_ORIENTATION=-